jgi:hypothetical protein
MLLKETNVVYTQHYNKRQNISTDSQAIFLDFKSQREYRTAL